MQNYKAIYLAFTAFEMYIKIVQRKFVEHNEQEAFRGGRTADNIFILRNLTERNK